VSRRVYPWTTSFDEFGIFGQKQWISNPCGGKFSQAANRNTLKTKDVGSLSGKRDPRFVHRRLVSNGDPIFAVNGMQLVLSRGATPADLGTDTTTITAFDLYALAAAGTCRAHHGRNARPAGAHIEAAACLRRGRQRVDDANARDRLG